MDYVSFNNQWNPCIGCIKSSCKGCQARDGSIYPSQRTKTKEKYKTVQSDKFNSASVNLFPDMTEKERRGLIDEVGNLVAFVAVGDGMTSVGINNGDKIVVDLSAKPKDGDIIIGYVNNAFVCRRLIYVGGKPMVRREDGFSPYFEPKKLSVLGVMVGKAV